MGLDSQQSQAAFVREEINRITNMPTSPQKPCNSPGCQALTFERYCPEHEHKQRQSGKDYDERRASDPVLHNNAKIRSSQRWRQLRAFFIAQNPLCADPFGIHRRMNRTVSASQVHHVKPLGTHPELAFGASNLMALCTGCHARIEKQQSNEEAS